MVKTNYRTYYPKIFNHNHIRFKPKYDFGYEGRIYIAGRYYWVSKDTAKKLLEEKKGYIQVFSFDKKTSILTKSYVDNVNLLK